MKALITAAALALACAPASAEWSGGFSIGASDTSGFCDQYDRADCDRGTDMGYRVFLGYDLTPNLRIEGFWTYLGSARVEDRVNRPDSATVNVGGAGASMLGVLPLTRSMELFAGAGVMQAIIGEHRLERVGFMYETSSVAPVYGAGFRYRIDGEWSLRGQWEYFDIDAGTPLPIDMATIGLEFTF